MGTALVKYVPKTNKLRSGFGQSQSKQHRKLERKLRDARLNELDQEKLSTKVKKGAAETIDFIEDFIDEASLSDFDKAAGHAADKAGKFAKKVGKKIGITAGRVKRAGSWVKNNKGKTALGVGAVGAGVAMATKDDNKSLKSQLRRIKAKDPSERTASEKRLLRLMEE